jgi:hypothetical protein
MSQIGDALSIVGATVIGAGVLWGISKLNKTMKRYKPTQNPTLPTRQRKSIRSPQRKSSRSPQRKNVPPRTSFRTQPLSVRQYSQLPPYSQPPRSSLRSSNSNSSSSNTSEKKRKSMLDEVKSKERNEVNRRINKRINPERSRIP